MEAHEAFGRYERSHHAVGGGPGGEPSFTMRAALTVAVLAALLAVATFLGNEAIKDAIQNETKAAEASSHRNSFETQREQALLDGAIMRAMSVSSDHGVAVASKAGADELDKHTKEFGAASKALDAKVVEARAEVGHANDQHLVYELAIVALQIGIVLASVSIIARRGFLLAGSTVAGLVGVVVLIVGLTQ